MGLCVMVSAYDTEGEAAISGEVIIMVHCCHVRACKMDREVLADRFLLC